MNQALALEQREAAEREHQQDHVAGEHVGEETQRPA